MPSGVVKWFNPEKGYGFIQQDGDKDIFVHVTDVMDESLNDGDKVEFEVGQGRKGPCAKEVKKV